MPAKSRHKFKAKRIFNSSIKENMEHKSLTTTRKSGWYETVDGTVVDITPTILAEAAIKTLLDSPFEKPSSEDEEKKPEFVNNGGFVTLNEYFQVEQGVYTILKRNIQRGVNTLLLGPTGVGKTELVSNIAKELNLPLTIFDMGTMTDPIMSLVGTHVIKMEDGTTSSQFVKSRFSEVIQQPGIILLDELSRASATANNLLFPCLDFRKELPMEYCFDDVEPVKVHPNCVFLATANLGGQYTGTHKLDRALQDRFMLMEIDPLNAEQTVKAIQASSPSIDEDIILKIVHTYDQINNAHDNFTIGFNMSIRHLKMIAEMVEDGFTVYDAFYTICKGLGSKDGVKAVEHILQSTKK